MLRLSPVFLVLLLAACAAPAPIVVPDPIPQPPSVPEFGALVLSGTELLVYPDASATGPNDVTRVNNIFAGGANGTVFFSASTADSTLLLRSQRGVVSRVHGVSGVVVYSVAWSPDGAQAAIGHYRPAADASPGRPRMGAGDILVFDGTSVSSVGCSASRAVLGWTADGRLLVRNTDNLYVIERDGCRTVSTVDARRMHALTVSPDVQHLVFVHRELEFDRATRSYVADSTFRITDLAGENARTVVSFKYRPQGFAWRADATELAFDVVDPNQPGARAISIFDLATGTASYLHPPTSAAMREFGPEWSPDGTRMAYSVGIGNQATISVRTFAVQFPSVIADSEGATVLGWLDEDTLILRDSEGVSRVVGLSDAGSHALARADAVIQVWRTR